MAKGPLVEFCNFTKEVLWFFGISKVTPPQKTPPQQLVSTTNHQPPPPPPPPPPTKIILIMKRPRRGRSCDIHTYTTRKSARILLFYYSYFIIYTPFQRARDQCDRIRENTKRGGGSWRGGGQILSDLRFERGNIPNARDLCKFVQIQTLNRRKKKEHIDL